jgi:TIR domain
MARLLREIDEGNTQAEKFLPKSKVNRAGSPRPERPHRCLTCLSVIRLTYRLFVEREIVNLLKDHGIETWYSRDDIRAASDWERSIRQALSACDWFLVVLSPELVQSEWGRSRVALGHRKPSRPYRSGAD